MPASKTVYIVIITALVSIIGVGLIERTPSQSSISAAPLKQNQTVSSQNYITIGSVSRSDQNFIWLLDASNKKLLIYEYVNDMAIKLKAARDLQYDLNLPEGTAFPWSYKQAGYTPEQIKEAFDGMRNRHKSSKKSEK